VWLTLRRQTVKLQDSIEFLRRIEGPNMCVRKKSEKTSWTEAFLTYDNFKAPFEDKKAAITIIYTMIKT